MEFLKEQERTKSIKISDDELLELLTEDRQKAERFFSDSVADSIIMRYNLLHSNDEYYKKVMPKLSEKSTFTSSDVKDIVEWMMPSFTEVYFGADKVVGIFGRSPEDNPEGLEKVIQFQMQTQNNSYTIIDQWCRDAIEAGLGAVKLEWRKSEETKFNWYRLSADEYYSMSSDAEKVIKETIANENGTYDLLIKERVATMNQPLLQNVMPGEFIYLPETDIGGRNIFECHRRLVPFDELVRGEKSGRYKNVGKDFPFIDPVSEDNNSMRAIADAISNYSRNEHDTNYDVSYQEGQDARKLVVLHDCYGFYDVDGDGELEFIHAEMCNGRLLMAEIWPYDKSPIFTISFYANSYQKWKEGVADYLRDIQDLKTALIKQIIINTGQNNARQFAVDESNGKAVQDLIDGRQVIRLNLMGNRSVSDFVQAMPKYEISPETFTIVEMANTWSEQKTGITRYNQGLDADSLNKTATGISKIMAASQQRLRKMARDGAENGLIPLYKHLVELNRRHLDSNFTFRVSNEFFEFSPDDIKGEFDVMVTSNIGLQDKQMTIQNLMIMLSNILPQLLQLGVASPAGVFNTAKQVIKEMGFNSTEKYIGMSESEIEERQQLPNMLASALSNIGIAPDVVNQVVAGVMSQIQGGQNVTPNI